LQLSLPFARSLNLFESLLLSFIKAFFLSSNVDHVQQGVFITVNCNTYAIRCTACSALERLLPHVNCDVYPVASPV